MHTCSPDPRLATWIVMSLMFGPYADPFARAVSSHVRSTICSPRRAACACADASRVIDAAARTTLSCSAGTLAFRRQNIAPVYLLSPEPPRGRPGVAESRDPIHHRGP